MMADVHGAAYNRSPEVNGQCGDLPWQQADDSNGFVGIGGYESSNDGDNDTDDIGTYGPIPRPVENQPGGGWLTDRQRGYNSAGGGWN
jgi:hypothetical protein